MRSIAQQRIERKCAKRQGRDVANGILGLFCNHEPIHCPNCGSFKVNKSRKVGE